MRSAGRRVKERGSRCGSTDSPGAGVRQHGSRVPGGARRIVAPAGPVVGGMRQNWCQGHARD